MKTKNLLFHLSFWFIFFFISPCHAEDNVQIISSYNMAQYDNVIENFYYNNPGFKTLPVEEKIIKASSLFLGKPYNLGALGEGPVGKLDQDPLYRTDSFDCMTFVSTVLALVNSANLQEFKNNIKKINYKNGNVAYFKRNHFTNIDWNKNNQYNNFLEDYTNKLIDENGKIIAEVSTTIINRPSWYLQKTAANIKLLTKPNKDSVQNLLSSLHDFSLQTSPVKSKIYFLPLNKLFSADKTPHQYLFNQISSGSVIEIVRPKWNLKNEIGTDLDVSHMGIALRINNNLIFREASSSEKFGEKVIDVPLIEYLQNCLSNQTIKGINVQKIL
jgi:hypothetical protein